MVSTVSTLAVLGFVEAVIVFPESLNPAFSGQHLSKGMSSMAHPEG